MKLKQNARLLDPLRERLLALSHNLEDDNPSSRSEARQQASELAPVVHQLAVLLGLLSSTLSDCHVAPESGTEATVSAPIRTSEGVEGFVTISTTLSEPPKKKARTVIPSTGT